jgi:formamidopyrimidine-DNA glycosylase
LWLAHIHPEKLIKKLTPEDMKSLYVHTLSVLKRGIDFKGDSMSDYRTPSGEPGQFQTKHNVYQRKSESCKRKECDGAIERKMVGGRSAHFCPVCQNK